MMDSIKQKMQEDEEFAKNVKEVLCMVKADDKDLHEVEMNMKKGKPLITIPEMFETKEKASEEDVVKQPKHYMLDGLGVETIDVIRSVLGVDGFQAFCKGNVIKYMIRAEKKGHLEDYKKARVYLTWLIESQELDVDSKEQKHE